MPQQNSSINNCLISLRESVGLLGECVKILGDTTEDAPRLKKVLMTRKVFGLVPEMDLINAKKNFKNGIEPQIEEAIVRIEKEMARLKRRKINLHNKYDLQAVRLASSTKRDLVAGVSLNKINKSSIDELKLARLNLLRNKKERLKYSLSKLDLQDQKARLSIIPSLPHHNNVDTS